jgi:hypothetical protein
MMKSYEATYENGQIKWLSEQPEITSARIIVTILEETKPQIKQHPLPIETVAFRYREVAPVSSAM